MNGNYNNNDFSHTVYDDFYHSPTAIKETHAHKPLNTAPKLPLYILVGWSTLTLLLTAVLMCCGEFWSILFELFQLIPLCAAFAAVSYKNRLAAAFICCGISALYMAATALIRFYYPQLFRTAPDDLIINLVFMLPYLLSVMMMTVPKAAYNKKLVRCTERVQALIVDVQREIRRGSKGQRIITYCPTFEFYFRGINYTASEKVYSSSYKPIKGRTAELMIDPDAPYYITDIKMHTRTIIIWGIFGAISCFVSLFAFYIQMIYV